MTFNSRVTSSRSNSESSSRRMRTSFISAFPEAYQYKEVTNPQPQLGRSFSGFLDRVAFALENLEDRIKAGNVKKPLHTIRGIENRHMPGLISDRRPNRNELPETGTVNVIDGRQVQ